jgi:hypothetical protein
MRRKLEHCRLATAVLIALGACGPASAQPQKAPSKVAVGSYECWANGAPRLLMNFEIEDGTKYRDSDGKRERTRTTQARDRLRSREERSTV